MAAWSRFWTAVIFGLSAFSGRVYAAELCATAEQAALIQRQYAASPGQPPSVIATALGLTEAEVLSGLPSDQALGILPTELDKIWDSLAQWDNAMTLVIKDGNEFEIVGRVHEGQWSRDRRQFNLAFMGYGLAGHIKPESIGAIFAISLPTVGQARINGVLFMNPAGGMSFAIMVPNVDGRPAPTVARQFYDTLKIARGLPKRCGH